VVEGLVVPALGLGLVGWLVPRGLSLLWPEGVRALFVLGLVATIVMLVLSAGFFVALYLVSGVPAAVLVSDGWGPAAAHFGRLAVISALLWGPILVLSVAGLPRYWVKERW